jgi:subtilase family serine protease
MRASRPLLALCLCLVALACAVAPAGAATGVRVGEAPELPSGASFAGSVAPERLLDLYVALAPRDPAALASYAEEVATPGSPAYGQHLSVDEFAARFGPTLSQIATVRSALVAAGLEVGAPSANHLSLPVSATAAAAEAAFGTAIDRVDTAGGRVAFANSSAPRLPAAAAPYVQGVLGLDDVTLSHRSDAQPDPGTGGPATPSAGPTTSVLTGGPQPCADAIAQRENEGGYTADQVASAYGLSGFYAQGNFGAGQTVALLEMEPTLKADLDTYQACYGTQTAVEFVPIEGGAGPYEKGDDGESALDLEQLIGLAPGARLIVYEGPNPSEVALLSAYVSDDTAKIMSSSWGICEKESDPTEEGAFNVLLQEAAVQGQSFFVAAGDNGSTDCYEPPDDNDKSLEVDYPGSDPFATDVGGTQMTAPTAPPVQYIWNDAETKEGAGGGGVSKRFPMPVYQQDSAPVLGVIGPFSEGTRCGLAAGYCRQVPDVSADASPATGYIVHTEEKWQVTGGTSAAAPLWAAFAALTQASPACGGKTIGFANPTLYVLASTAYAGNFDDVVTSRPGGPTTTNLFSDSNPYPAAIGYDMATGLGTPVGTALGGAICGVVNVTPPPADASSTPPKATTTATTDPAPAPARVSGAHLGIRKGEPRLTFSLAAREGAALTTLTVGVPPALEVAGESGTLAKGIVTRGPNGARLSFTATSTPGTIRIRLRSPQPNLKLKVAFPALAATPKLFAHIRAGRTHKLGLVVTTRESGNQGTRLPLNVGV